MKKKVLTASILLAIIAIALVGYFVGCSQFGSDTVSSQTETDKPIEEEGVTFAELTEKPDSKPQELTEPQAMLFQLQKEAEEDEVLLRTKLEPP